MSIQKGYIYRCPTCKNEVIERKKGAPICGDCWIKYHNKIKTIFLKESYVRIGGGG